MSNHILKPGTKIGDTFEIQELLGSGGFGITYKAWDTEFERVVAIKEYFPFDLAERSGDDDTVVPRDPSKKGDFEDGLNRFVEEGRTLAKFADERIVRATRFINVNGTAYMVMEYQEGCSLSTFLADNDGPLSERQLLNIFVPIMQGLAKVHRANILHRDLKPDNIYIRTDGTPLLLDFGAARQKVVGKTRSLTSMLSPGYAPLSSIIVAATRVPGRTSMRWARLCITVPPVKIQKTQLLVSPPATRASLIPCRRRSRLGPVCAVRTCYQP